MIIKSVSVDIAVFDDIADRDLVVRFAAVDDFFERFSKRIFGVDRIDFMSQKKPPLQMIGKSMFTVGLFETLFLLSDGKFINSFWAKTKYCLICGWFFKFAWKSEEAKTLSIEKK